ncbi:MAG TPA: hypothetical protein PLY34_13105 [Ferruginibacter sp.]|nr:hypothetical protein [Ferruginibacter sp.]HPH92050.1 hypothetical protein [Ferruginibacter sp.]
MQTVSSNEHTADHQKTAAWVMRLVCICWLMAKLIGWKVWIKDRQFPLAPVAGWLNWPSLMQYILFVLSLSLIISLVFKPFNKIIIVTLLCSETLSCLADQNRWQPWQYQYFFTIAAFIINFKNTKNFIACIAFIMASTYFYSGIGKFNEGYLVLVWDNIFLKNIFKLSEEAYRQNSLHYLGYATALAEVLFAIGLFFSKTKKAAAWGMICMHLLILYALGPLGINYNPVIWPWNILMAILLFVVFIKVPGSPIHIKALWPGLNKAVLIAWGILPALNYVGLWDNYFSCRLYSGGLPQMAICLKDQGEIEELQPYINSTDIYNRCNGKAMINLQNWAVKEMEVLPLPEIRVYEQIQRQWMQAHPGSSARFVIYYINHQKPAPASK